MRTQSLHIEQRSSSVTQYSNTHIMHLLTWYILSDLFLIKILL